jgi:tetratricopeptide (TPR) repeat protein
MRYLFKIFMLLLCPVLCQANSNNSIDATSWQRANDLYNQKRYDSALSTYLSLARPELKSSELFYNIGNAYFKLNEVGQAILYYERALLIDPENKAIQDNLTLAQMRITKPIPQLELIFFQRWWHSLLQLMGTNGWALMAFIAFSILVALVYRSLRKKINYAGRWISFAAVLFLFFLMVSLAAYDRQHNTQRAVILAEQSPILEQPKPGGKISSSAPEGTTVNVLQQKDNYTEIQLPNGRVGWVLNGNIALI